MTFDLNRVPPQKGKIAIVTGANVGLGYETAFGLAKTGMKVVMACRNLQKAEAAKSNLLQSLPEADVEIMPLDLSKLASVRSFCQAFNNKYEVLNLLINNAGIMVPPYELTEDGFESQFMTNYLGHFLLSSLLLPLMPDHSDSRVVSLSSIAHRSGSIDFHDLQSQRSYSRSGAYSQSKLACLMFANELHKRLDASGKKVLSVCAHPGISNTALVRNLPAALESVVKLTVMPFIGQAAAQGALPTLMAALDEDVKGGEYFGPKGLLEMRGKPGRAYKSWRARNSYAARKLWSVSEELVGSEFVIQHITNHV